MARSEDWLKMRAALIDDPRIDTVARELNTSVDCTLGKMLRFWTWACNHTTTGRLNGVTEEWIDETFGRDKLPAGVRPKARKSAPTFCLALKSAGFLTITSKYMTLPRFDRYLSQSAKRKALTRDRVAFHRRNKSVTDVTHRKRLAERREGAKAFGNEIFGEALDSAGPDPRVVGQQFASPIGVTGDNGAFTRFGEGGVGIEEITNAQIAGNPITRDGKPPREPLSVVEQIDALSKQILGEVEGAGTNAKREIDKDASKAISRAREDEISRGAGGSGGASALASAILVEAGDRKGGVEERVAQQRAQIKSAFGMDAINKIAAELGLSKQRTIDLMIAQVGFNQGATNDVNATRFAPTRLPPQPIVNPDAPLFQYFGARAAEDAAREAQGGGGFGFNVLGFGGSYDGNGGGSFSTPLGGASYGGQGGTSRVSVNPTRGFSPTDYLTQIGASLNRGATPFNPWGQNLPSSSRNPNPAVFY